MNFSPFSSPFSWGTQRREAAAPKASGCFMGGTCAVREEPGKQKPRSCRAQELARSSAHENAAENAHLPGSVESAEEHSRIGKRAERLSSEQLQRKTLPK